MNISNRIAWRKSALGRSAWRPWVTIVLIAINVLVYVAQLLSSGVQSTMIFAPVIGSLQPYRFLSSAFLHGGFWHIAFNMYALWLVGENLERMIGRWRFAVIYLFSAAGGNVFVLLVASPLAQSWVTGVVGASGAVFGLFGALFILVRKFGGKYTSLLVVIVLNLLLGFLPGSNISWQSHVGGLLVGCIAMAVTARRFRHPRVKAFADGAAYLVIAVLLVTAVIWKYQTIG